MEGSTDPRVWIAVCAIVGLIGVGAGVGGTLLFVERGPEGSQGEIGPRGPRGPAGDVEAATQDLDARVSELEFADPAGLEVRVSDLEARADEVDAAFSDPCFVDPVNC